MTELKKSSNRISAKKLSNLKVVVLCIAAATTFWILNALNKDDYNTIVNFPIDIMYDQTQFVPVTKLPETLEIEISGNGWDLLRKYFNFNNDAYPIELNNPAVTNYILTADLKRSIGDFLSPTQLVSVVNDTLRFDINKIITVNVAPALDSTSYSMAKNFRIIDKITFSPETITMRGPSSILDSLTGSFPILLDEKRINKSIDKEISLKTPEALEDLVQIEQEKINVSFDVIEFLEGNKRLKIRKLNLKPMPAYLEQIMPQPAVLKLKYE